MGLFDKKTPEVAKPKEKVNGQKYVWYTIAETETEISNGWTSVMGTDTGVIFRYTFTVLEGAATVSMVLDPHANLQSILNATVNK